MEIREPEKRAAGSVVDGESLDTCVDSSTSLLLGKEKNDLKNENHTLCNGGVGKNRIEGKHGDVLHEVLHDEEDENLVLGANYVFAGCLFQGWTRRKVWLTLVKTCCIEIIMDKFFKGWLETC
ncbi:hypothetical protein ACOSQ4_003134 [Xanthoceras sorbifolium]